MGEKSSGAAEEEVEDGREYEKSIGDPAVSQAPLVLRKDPGVEAPLPRIGVDTEG